MGGIILAEGAGGKDERNGDFFAKLSQRAFDKVMRGESMALRIKIRGGERPLTVEDDNQSHEAPKAANEEARKRGTLGAVLIEAANGNLITMVVGGNKRALGFDCGHYKPPYYASRVLSSADEPILTCQLPFHHHTGFPRKYVIPIADGKAFDNFFSQ